MNRSVSEVERVVVGGDAFVALGLPRAFDLDRETIETCYLTLAQKAHPDKFATASSHDQRAALERSAAINDAYRIVRDPVRRAEHLVRLGGIDLDSEAAPHMSQGFLIDMIERRERVESTLSRGGAELEAYRVEIEDEEASLFDRAVVALTDDVGEAARLLVARRYLQRLLDEIDLRLT